MVIKTLVFLSFTLFLTFSFYKPKNKKSKKSVTLLGGLAFSSVIALICWIFTGCPTLILTFNLFSSHLQIFNLSFMLDHASMVFVAVALIVTWSIMEFSHYYMSSDPKKGSFMACLILFLLFMLMLVSSKSLFLLFVGWEGVGMLSFILMGWWFTRSDAKSAALQAMMYNRMGDSGIMLFLGLAIIFFNSWDLNEVLFMATSSWTSSLAALGLTVAAVGKSAQFLLHPWLPSAMEGPTPVSALLHSSTMVVAGVFLLIRSFPIIKTTTWALPSISIIGSTTAIFAASVALFQYDMKKVVAYSTTSQLGLMVAAIGLGLPQLAFFHICTHAFFKALLFLCSGSVIHSFKKEQDLRKMGSATNAAPFTTSALLIASLALCGIPFLAGFYSKDLMLEAGSASLSNSIGISLAFIATFLTAAYSFRVVYYTAFYSPKNLSSVPASEENWNLLFPLVRLLVGALIAGWALSLSLFKFFPLLVPLMLKKLPLLVTAAATVIAIKALMTTNYVPITHFLAQKWYYVQIWHATLSKKTKETSLLGVLRTFDQGWAAQMGAQGIVNWTKNMASTTQKTLSGMVTKYLTYSLLLAMMGATILYSL